MTNEEIIRKLKAEAGHGCPTGARARVAEETGLPYGYICRLVYDEISNPGSQQLDKLRQRYEKRRH